MSKRSDRVRRGKRDESKPRQSALSPSEGLSEEDAALILDTALARARAEGRRLFTTQRGLVAGSAVMAVIVAARGIVAVALGARPAIELAVALGAALALSGALLVVGLRTRTKMERLTRDVDSLEAARDTKATSGTRVEIHPYRVADGVVRPVVVVRTDDVERVFSKGEATPDPGLRSWPTRAIAGAAVLVAILGSLSALTHGTTPASHRWTFLDEASSPASLGFRMGPMNAGPWAVEPDGAATGARALVNRSGEGDAPAATLVSTSINARDVKSMTRCRVSPGRSAGACGLVFRYADDATHHLARIEVGSGRIVLSRVSGGSERELGSADVRAEPGIWYELGVEARGDAIRVFYNGRPVVEIQDGSPAPAGTVGLWAPAETEAFFDELSVEVLAAAPQAVEVLPLLKRRSS